VTESLSPSAIHETPTSISGFSDLKVVKLCKGPALVKAPDETLDFWGFLYSWGGTWMWEGIEANRDLLYNVTWVADRMKNISLIWGTGSLASS
jgi:hypothetical protein